MVVSLSVWAESPAMVELESVTLVDDMVEVESLIVVVDVSFDSVLLLEQAVASTIIDNRKKADFAMIIESLIRLFSSVNSLKVKK